MIASLLPGDMTPPMIVLAIGGLTALGWAIRQYGLLPVLGLLAFAVGLGTLITAALTVSHHREIEDALRLGGPAIVGGTLTIFGGLLFAYATGGPNRA